jgi:hypothetical protein
MLNLLIRFNGLTLLFDSSPELDVVLKGVFVVKTQAVAVLKRDVAQSTSLPSLVLSFT